MDLINGLSNEFPIYPVQEIREIGKGISSNAKSIVTSDRKYILRKVRDREQAITEYKISKVLSKHNFSPDILLNKRNQPFIEIYGDIYNLQTYIPNHHVENKIDYCNLGKVTSVFHSEIQRVDGLFEQYDRFSLSKMWDQLKQNNDFEQADFNRQLTKMVDQCLNYHHEDNCYIHGDLGKWNLLFYKKNIYIIDFGEVRRGNNHFDISAVISSTIDWERGEREIIDSLTDFKKGYISNFEQFDWSILRENLTLWFTRGIVTLLVNNGINNRTSNTLKLFMEKRNRLDHIVKHLLAR